MNKKNIISIFVLLLIIVGTVFIANNQNLLSLVGFSTMAISNVNYIEDGEVQDAFAFDIISNGGGEFLTLVVDPSDIAASGLDILPEAFTVTTSLKNPVCTYRIENTDDIIYRLYQATARYSFAERCGSSTYGLDKPCPYDKINLNTVKAACEDTWNPPTDLHNPEYCAKTYAAPGTGTESPGSTLPRSANCDSLVDVQKTSVNEQFGGDPSEWCYSMQRNIVAGFDNDHWEVTHVAGEPYYEVERIGTKAFLDYEVEVNVTNKDGVLVSKTVNSRDKVVDLDGFGRVKLVGLLGADEFCENPAIDYQIITNSGGSKFIDRDLVRRYSFNLKDLQNFDNNYYVYKQTDPGIGRDVIWSYISGANGALNSIYAYDKSPLNCKIESNKVVCKPETAVAYPNLQLILKSTYVGISEDRREEINDRISELEGNLGDLTTEQQQELESLRQQLLLFNADLQPLINIPQNGIPKIISATVVQEELKDNDIGVVKVVVKNIGTDDDTFNVDLRCGDDEISFGAEPKSIRSLQEETFNIFVNGNTGVYNCKVVASSYNQEQNRDEKAIAVTFVEDVEVTEPTFLNLPKGVPYITLLIASIIILLVSIVLVVRKSKK